MGVIKLGVFGIEVSLFGNDSGDVGGTIESQFRDEDCSPELGAAYDAIESMILAHACSGIDVSDPKYLEGIEIAAIGCFDRLEG